MAKKCVVNYNGKGEVSSMSVRNLNYNKNPIKARQEFQKMVENLIKTGLGDKVFTDWKAFKKAAGVKRNDFIGNNVRGAVATKNGYIYINKNDLKPDTLIHEFTHLWFDYMKHNNKPLYMRLLNKIKENKELMDSNRNDENYSNIHHDENLIADEALAREVGARGLKQIQQPWLFDIFREFWDYVKSILGAKKTSILKWTEEQWRSASLGEVTREMARSLIEGENIKSGKAISSDTLLHSILDQNDFDVDGSVKQEVLDEINAEKEHIREQSIADGTYLKAPNGVNTNLTDEQWVLTRTRRFKKWFGDFEVYLNVDISNLNQVSDIANGVLSGKIKSDRLDEISEQGRIESGNIAVESAIILEQTVKNLQNEESLSQRVSQGGIRESSEIGTENDGESIITEGSERTGGEKTSDIGIQEQVLEDYARRRGVWFENVDGEVNQFGDFLKEGNENIVYLNDDSRIVTKINNLNHTGGNPMLYLDYVAMFNGMFKGSTIKVIGFTRLSDGNFGVVTQQPFIQAEEGVSSSEVSEYMRNLGFTEIGDGDFINDNVYVQDLHQGNILKDNEGNIIVIDNIMEFNSTDAGFGGQHERGRINNRGNEDVSKVVDENGEPKVVYHITGRDFTKFDESFSFAGDFGIGFYFGENLKQIIEDYGGGKVMSVFLNMKIPRVEKNRHGFDNIIDDSDKLGYEHTYSYLRAEYDGVIVTDPVFLSDERGKHFIVFNPNQIKSANDNVGTFSRDNDDIRFLFGNVDNISESQINEAQRLEQEGKTEQEIIEKTGLIKSLTNKWKKVIGNGIGFIANGVNLSEYYDKHAVYGHYDSIRHLVSSDSRIPFEKLFKFKELFEEYPQLKNKIEVFLYNNLSKDDDNGYKQKLGEKYIVGLNLRRFRENGGRGEFDNQHISHTRTGGEAQHTFDIRRLLGTTLHELQHIIQEEDGEPTGTSPKVFEKMLRKGEITIVRNNEPLNLSEFAKKNIKSGKFKDMEDFYTTFSYRLYRAFIGEVEARAGVDNSYDDITEDMQFLIYPKSKNEFVLSHGRLSDYRYDGDNRLSNNIDYLFGNVNNVSEEQLMFAEQLEREGKTEQEIVKEVGVIKTPNNKWVPVIDNNIQSIISNEEVNEVVKINKLQDGGENALIDNGVKLDFEKVFKFDELFKHYPEFKNKIEVLLYEDKRKIPQNEGGFAYLSKRGSLGIAIQAGNNSELSIGNKNEEAAQLEGVYPTVLHEIQHLIQFSNGEVVGTHPSIIYNELMNDRMRFYNVEGDRIDLNLLADSYIEQGLVEDMNDFYMRFSVDLYNSFLGEVNARAAETNSYENVLSEVGVILFPVSKNDYILSDERLSINPYVTQQKSNLGSDVGVESLQFLNESFVKTWAFLPEIVESRDDIEIQNCR